jgi:hypothetical protein
VRCFTSKVRRRADLTADFRSVKTTRLGLSGVEVILRLWV